MRLRADFIHVRVPAAYVGKRHFQPDVGFDQPRDLLRLCPSLPFGYCAPAAGV